MSVHQAYTRWSSIRNNTRVLIRLFKENDIDFIVSVCNEPGLFVYDFFER